MKKRVWLGLICLLFASCASTQKQSNYYLPQETKTPFVYEVRSVTVTVDYIDEKVIADQFYNLLITELSAQETQITGKEIVIPVEDVVYLDVTINQRAFIQDIQQKNSIYITFTGYDSDDNVVLRENAYFAGKENFISSVDQYNCGKKIITNLLNYQSGVNKVFLKANEE